MNGSHDVGGQAAGLVDRAEHELTFAERQVDAISQLLRAKGYFRTDANRRSIEDIDPETYSSSTYYERWAIATRDLMVELGLITHAEFDLKFKEVSDRSAGDLS